MKRYDPALYPFKSQWIEIEHNNMHYIDEGEGQIILFSHPAVGSSFMYRTFIRELSPHFRCIALDYPGFGLSCSATHYAYDIEIQSAVLEKFIQRLGLQNIIVLGHDTGGPSAFQVATHHPGLFKGLILTDTIIFPVSEYPKVDKMLNLMGSSAFQWVNAATNLLITLTYRFGIRTRKLSRAERKQYALMFDTAEKRRAITKVLYSLKENETMMQTIIAGFENQLNTKPVLLMYGEHDPVQQLGIPDRILHTMPNAELHLIKGEGHFPHEAQPEQMSSIIKQWIEKLERIPVAQPLIR